jgi:hypothetical protein
LNYLKGIKLISMKRIFWVFIASMTLVVTNAQEADPDPDLRPTFNISGNFGGDASLFSLGFEKLFFLNPGLALAGKIAFGYNQEFQIFSSKDPSDSFILPHSFTVNLGNGKRSFGELGFGGSWISNSTDNYYLIYPIIGYRYHPFKNPGFSFKAWFFYPFGQVSKVEDTELLISPFGVSFGIAL